MLSIDATRGYMGGTEEGYMVFRSYRYVSDPDIAGRYTFLQVFDETYKPLMPQAMNQMGQDKTQCHQTYTNSANPGEQSEGFSFLRRYP